MNKYRTEGYAFVAITDHRIYYSLSEDLYDIITLNGCEYNCYLDEPSYPERVHFHLLTLKNELVNSMNPVDNDDNRYKGLFYTSVEEVQGFIDELIERGNIVFIAHPKNPSIPLEILLLLKHYSGVEVYNEKARMDASDVMLSLYQERPGLSFTSVDDAHAYMDNQNNCLYFKGFIVVEDCVVNRVNIVNALINKKFYASNGPSLFKLLVEDDFLFVKCSRVKSMTLTTFKSGSVCKTTIVTAKNHLSSGRFSLEKGCKEFIIEIVDFKGNKAWYSR